MMEDTSSDNFKNVITKEPEHIKPEMVIENFAKSYPIPVPNTYQRVITKLGRIFGTCGVCCFLCSNPYEEVQQGEVGLIRRFGALQRTVEPGLSYVNTWSERLTRVSVKITIADIPAQSCFTRDNVSVVITSVVYYNIIDPQKAIFSIADIHTAIMERTQTTLRDVIGNRVLQDVVEKREEIAVAIESIIAKTAFDWGVNIESILIKDLSLPPKVQESLSMAAEAKRIGESKIINAKAEVESAKLMRKAADILASKPAMQIRYLDAMQSMARNAGSKVIFMPSSNEVERMASSISGQVPTGQEEVSENLTGSGLDPRSIENNISLQEAIRN
ncbi:hypothetical protein PSN45_003547 [Yamadazyma tenuis]|uniref:Band 7 domain-containing protein n=1 Tax=Candida tenuis (strain ATCC 10573 / BCRC 21748 / CBS 615 / JCM 9827 / NBRC 10315 / NRRL Y-1498 / VKM Y-70) TaxID=590646 RepID=G3AXQ9_CANTC|nr:uncharacterized protein CANTEDRAFT_112544 [Yamadazyma tenuis ATCC 10573]XP_006684703.1 uncharacterized protein CANTEDRAFT_112544 [Yamadazyma tenuis ATCC 10573]EGV66128.1 hypothetical protein CANTEDRAFT_112544 [Yamadazyma tenuis ATCC 10573]EGV66129.1 hypothetical protein CANTEDRAFT_112544 [Yamadazyma tenuis ATCC 10573]WEJ96013.1 hypothetical protein PSN45_003547 [Yamadazyma tenuis]